MAKSVREASDSDITATEISNSLLDTISLTDSIEIVTGEELMKTSYFFSLVNKPLEPSTLYSTKNENALNELVSPNMIAETFFADSPPAIIRPIGRLSLTKGPPRSSAEREPSG